MISDLLEHGARRIIGADIDPAAVTNCNDRFPGEPLELRVVAEGDTSIMAEECDVLAPNAIGATLNPRTTDLIRATVVCGAANNQLEDPRRDATALGERGILYVPDFLANRMGIVNCANEQYGVFAADSGIAAHLDRDTPTGVFLRCLEVLRRAESSGRTPEDEAEVLADELSREPHPIWGNRGQEIINHLVASGWSNGKPQARDEDEESPGK